MVYNVYDNLPVQTCYSDANGIKAGRNLSTLLSTHILCVWAQINLWVMYELLKNTYLQDLVNVLHLKTVKINSIIKYKHIKGMHIGHLLTLVCILTAVILIFIIVRL